MAATFRNLPKGSAKDRYIWHSGDCVKLLSLLDDESVALTVTSPPYNIGKEYEERLDLSRYLLWQKRIIQECVRVTKKSGSICWQVGNYVRDGKIIPLDVLLYPTFRELGLQLRNRIVWTSSHGMHANRRFSGRYETILWFTRSDDYVFNLDSVRVPQKWPKKKAYKGPRKGEYSCNPLGKNPGDVWDITNIKSNHTEKIPGGHPCQFPLTLVERLILALSRPNDLILDPFGGVATSIVAALRTNRIGLSAEIDTKYFRLGKARIEASLGEEKQPLVRNRMKRLLETSQ